MKRLILCTIIFLASCDYSTSIDVTEFSNITITNLQQENVERRVFEPNSPDLKQLTNWLETNFSGWEKYLVTEPVGEYLVQAGPYQFNIGQGWVIVTNENGMYSKPVSNELYNIVHAIASQGE